MKAGKDWVFPLAVPDGLEPSTYLHPVTLCRSLYLLSYGTIYPPMYFIPLHTHIQ